MAIPFKRMGRKDPRKIDGVLKYHPQLVTMGQSVDLDGIAYIMKDKSSLSLGDIQSVLTNYVEAMRAALFDGKSVNIRDFGVFSLSAHTLGATTKEECTVKNIKSIRYLESDNYRRLLQFIDSAPYQIYIMGHSCGNSDRTLLNTLFEHPKCVSIKPFYYQWQDEQGEWRDNYIEIIQNISRNFNSMQTMRDRMVNKEFCRPLEPKHN